MPKPGTFTSETAKEAGKKGKRPPGQFTDLIKQTDPAKVSRIWATLLEEADNGNMEAIKLALAYLMGKPKESMDMNVTGGGFKLNIIPPDGRTDV